MILEDRITRVEAELAIRNVIARYGLAADCGDVATALNCQTEDAVYMVSNPNAGRGDETSDLELKDHQAIADMLNSEMHQSLLPDCAHTVARSSWTLKVIPPQSSAIPASITIKNSYVSPSIIGRCAKKVAHGKSLAARAVLSAKRPRKNCLRRV